MNPWSQTCWGRINGILLSISVPTRCEMVSRNLFPCVGLEFSLNFLAKRLGRRLACWWTWIIRSGWWEISICISMMSGLEIRRGYFTSPGMMVLWIASSRFMTWDFSLGHIYGLRTGQVPERWEHRIYGYGVLTSRYCSCNLLLRPSKWSQRSYKFR